MRKSIVFKLFLLTAALCTSIIAGLFILQTVFFKQFYVHQKVESVQNALDAAAREIGPEGIDSSTAAYQKEQQFYQDHNTWIAQLDSAGHLMNTDNFQIEVQLEAVDNAPFLSGRSIMIPLYTMMDVEDLREDYPLRPEYLGSPGQRIAIEGILFDDRLQPQRIGKARSNLREENQLVNEPFTNKEYEVVERLNAHEYREQYPSVIVEGIVTEIRKPEGADESRYVNHLFLERIKTFQADLLYGDFDESSDTIIDYVENSITYKIFVTPLANAGSHAKYLFAMTSLQPVDEAVGVTRHYYGYIIAATLLLVLLASYYYARRIVRPLLRMNEVTQRIAGLDFSDRIPVKTDDEIGGLSRSINDLSGLLQAHIERLEHDIEQEKRLEQTRKAFISGVSHELKTPLSVIESCLYILRNKPLSDKRDYYFTALEDEVKKMNLLIEDMLELAKYESGTYRMELTPLRIDAVLERVCTMLAPELTARTLQLHSSLFPVTVLANPLRIEQVIVNFLTNAVRYTPEGEHIHVSIAQDRGTALVSIENKGISLPEDQLEQIWDRFYRGERSRHRATGGTGLGLAISKQILELHGARFGVCNTEDGVLFFFELNTVHEA